MRHSTTRRTGWRIWETAGHVSMTSVPRKVVEQISLSAITQNVQDNQGIRPSQHGVRKVRSPGTNTISFYDKVICLVHKGKAVDVVFLDLNKGFYSVSHSILPGNLAAHGLDMCAVIKIKNLSGWLSQKSGGEWCHIWQPVTSGDQY